MHKIKLILTMVISVITISLFTAMPAFALTEGDWEFQLLDNEVEITGYNGQDEDIIIPETIYGCPVTSLDFKSNFIGDSAKSITIKAKIKEFNNIFWGSSSVEKVVLPEGLEVIGDSAFSQCQKLCNINIPTTVKKIGQNAFNGCVSLKSVILPENLEIIEYQAFNGSGLEEIYIPAVSKGMNTFANCDNLKKAELEKGNTTIAYGMFDDCPNLEEIIIPNSITDIGAHAFRRCKSLKNLILPTSLKEIGEYAFSGCDMLAEVVIPNGVEYTGSKIFASCDNLKSLYIPDSVTEMSWSIVEESPNAIIYCSNGSYAAEHCKKNKISYLTDNSVNSGITVLYNGTRISFHSYGQNPELLNSRTLVPLRSIFEAMGADVEWDNTTSTAIAKRDGVEIKIQIGANEMYKDGKAIAVDVPAQLMNSRTMVPVRVIAEAFGADVQWNGNGNTVLINE